MEGKATCCRMILRTAPIRTLLRAGGQPADQERAEIREGGLDADQDGTTTGYLSDRVPGKR
mgnify:CR=1 FL=1